MAKKSNTTTYLLAGGAAALAFFLFRKSASAKVTPVGPVLPPEGGDGDPPVQPPEDTDIKRDAPSMGQTKQQAISAGKVVVGTYVDQVNAIVEAKIRSTLEPDFAGPLPEAEQPDVLPARATLGIPGNRTVASWIADQAYFGLFGNSAKVPAAQNRGSGWKPYIDVWNALWAAAKSELLRGVNSN